MITNTISELEEHLQKIDNRLQNPSLRGARMSDEIAAEGQQVQEESESIKQCLSICAQASEQLDKVRINVFDDVSSDQESHQVVVSTLGDLISARRVNAGMKSMHWLGQMSDDSLQQLSQNRGIAGDTATKKTIEQQSEISESFEDKYGAGHTLTVI